MENAAVPLAVYAVAMKVNDLVLAFTTVINRYQLPTITRLVTVNNDTKSLITYLGKNSRFVAILYVAIIIGFIFFGQKFIYIYAGSGYELAYPIILIVIIASALSRIHGCGADVLKAKNKHGLYTTIVFFTAVLNVILTIILIKKYGIVGAAIGTAISVILGNTIAYYACLYTKCNINIKELFKITFKGFIPVIIISIIVGFLLNYIINDSSLIKYLLKGAIFLIVYLGLIYKFILSDVEKENIKNKIKRY